MAEKKRIVVSDIKNYLSNGVTRKTCSKGYTEEKSSIQEIYGLTKTEVDELFQYSKLKGLKTKFVKESSFEIIDDELESDLVSENTETVVSTAPQVEPPMAVQVPVQGTVQDEIYQEEPEGQDMSAESDNSLEISEDLF